MGGSAVRCGDFKLYEDYGRDKVELYNLREDLSEKNNLAEKNPEVVARLRQTFDAWKSQLAPSISKAKRARQSSGKDAPRKRNRKNR